MANYAFKTMEDRQKIEKLWEDGQMPKEISETTGVSICVVHNELTRRRDGTRLPDQHLRYSAELAQHRGKRTGQPTESDKAAEAAGR